MASVNVLQLIEEAGTIAIEISADAAELTAGAPVQLPKVQIGSSNGKPIYLEAVLTETP